MSRAERRAERRRAHRPAPRGTGGPGARGTTGVGRGQQRIAIILLATLAIVGLAIIAAPFTAPPPGP